MNGISLMLGGGSIPDSYNLSGWWRAPYSGLPWTPRASGGTSAAAGNFETNADDPNVGTTLNGYACLNFDGIGHNARDITIDITNLVTVTSGSLIVLVQGDAQSNPGLNVYDSAAIFMDSNADFGFVYSTTGLTAVAYDGTYRFNTVTMNTGAPHLIMMTVDGSNLTVTVDSSAPVPTTCGTLAALTGTLALGRGYGGTWFFNGRIWEIMTSKDVISSSNYASIKSYINTRYALSL